MFLRGHTICKFAATVKKQLSEYLHEGHTLEQEVRYGMAEARPLQVRDITCDVR